MASQDVKDLTQRVETLEKAVAALMRRPAQVETQKPAAPRSRQEESA